MGHLRLLRITWWLVEAFDVALPRKDLETYILLAVFTITDLSCS